MACGEGYGSEVLSRSAAAVLGVDANPEAHEHARLRYVRQNLRFERGVVETYGEPGAFDAVVFLQTIEHVQDPVAVLEHFRSLLAPGGTVYVSTPNLLTLAPPGADQVRESLAPAASTGPNEFRELCATVFGEVELLGLFHARKLARARPGARARLGHGPQALRLTKPFYDRFTPAIATSDFALRADQLDAALDFLAVCRV